MGKGELNVRLALILPVTATVCRLSSEKDLVVEEGGLDCRYFRPDTRTLSE